jgi:hypothetical protein
MKGFGCARPVDISHRRILLSSEPDAMMLESGDQAMVDMPARWPSSVCSSFPDALSQTLTVQSADADAIHFPSGEYLTCDMPFLWPRRIRDGL